MRQYRPTIEELKKRYAKEQARKHIRQWLHEQNPARALRKHVPYQAESLLGHPPRTVAECAWISEQIGRFQDAQREHFLRTHSCGA
jgi:hypothetical protein